jgi:hypothetical protein
MNENETFGLTTSQLPMRLRCDALAALLLLTMALVACRASPMDREAALQGRWHRLSDLSTSDSFVGDPFGSLAGEYFEFRPGGVLASLLYDPGPQQFWTTRTGEYAVASVDQVTVKGQCWRGWQSYDCWRTYRFELQRDRLTIYDPENEQRHVEYTRRGAASVDLPPTLIPPMPSATPPAE